ncbi:Mannose-6-phosphate isomerase, class I [Pedobacter steynii]|uniref:Mannose-6-phosphate isomerase, class I n=1 Tax=Pedobacter steynii TaxID=430522 RepID=A0A1G9PH36_9SPHI|nr:class I mannose-6-phosphate isomerase [Pedobacter steynii]NQX38984.1 class I mannose-6-phosphate isomerase [Pedobacter steynii]SDL98182.1 Mannose-6-phosphate isomerase, class I [Pedobacter steynii]
MTEDSENTLVTKTHEAIVVNNWRHTSQPLLPIALDKVSTVKNYEPSPFFSLEGQKIVNGFGALTDWIIEQDTVLIDGYGGVFFKEIQLQIQKELDERGISVKWHQTSDYFKPETELERLTAPFLGGENEVWGRKTDLELKDFFRYDEILAIKKDETKTLNIIIGAGAGLVKWDAPVIYFEIPKNEIQYRMKAGAIANLGSSITGNSFSLYKRFYFVDWVLLNRHRSALLNRISIVADGQWLDEVNWMFKGDLEKGLHQLSHAVIRARPWFESGSWGGQWMKKHLEGLNKAEINYAWSFELITPENGIVLESDGKLLEITFDLLMELESKAILGKHAAQFGTYFPIRFDFLDTFQGGNLSIQCHPSKTYIQENFGETITQDETYYIMDCEPDAKVYLGFQEDINPAEFRRDLENSQLKNEKIEIEKYVQSFPSRKHELFLIPGGTVHSSGANNMVLEISATPYIFTFKMYDWLSLGLDGKPRPINIEHAFNNLRFERKGTKVQEELISHQQVIEKGADWELVKLPTHQDHFYEIERIEFDTEVLISTDHKCHILMLVEGTAISAEVKDGNAYRFNYAETFIVPAATGSYKLINHGRLRAKVIKVFLKDDSHG